MGCPHPILENLTLLLLFHHNRLWIKCLNPFHQPGETWISFCALDLWLELEGTRYSLTILLGVDLHWELLIMVVKRLACASKVKRLTYKRDWRITALTYSQFRQQILMPHSYESHTYITSLNPLIIMRKVLCLSHLWGN